MITYTIQFHCLTFLGATAAAPAVCLAIAPTPVLVALLITASLYSTVAQGTTIWDAHTSTGQELPSHGVAHGAVPVITCELLIEGGNTQPINGTTEHHGSITRAHLACTGGVLVVSLHPVLHPFAAGFQGVAVDMPKGSEKLLKVGLFGNTPVVFGHCQAQNPNSEPLAAYLITICAEGQVDFVRARLVNLPQLPPLPQNATMEGPAPAAYRAGVNQGGGAATIGGIGVLTGHVVFYAPTFMHIPGIPLADADYGRQKSTGITSMSLVGGLFDETGGVLCGVMTRFVRTRFRNSHVNPFGGAVMVMTGRAEFHQCVFDSNKAPTLDQLTGGKAGVNILRSGLGGAVLASTQAGTHSCQVLFVGCTFTNNTAFQGGALAIMGADATIEGCRFANNVAAQDGWDVYAGAGSRLSLTHSNINVQSPSVQWDHAPASECFRGEYFGVVEGVCRRCPPATFSLQTPATKCLPCPPNAQVGLPLLQWVHAQQVP